MPLKPYQTQFIQLLVEADALKFGSFTLKSGRQAPYFLNTGTFFTGECIHGLAHFYAEALLDTAMEVDVIFGPAYKGIPLAVATVSVLFSQFNTNMAYCFNRKEAKHYGDAKGAVLLGAPLNEHTKVVLIDDVITAGTAISESMEILQNNGNPEVVGVLIAMNRMEKNNEGKNALEEIEDRYGCKIFSIVTLDDVIEALYNKPLNGRVYIDDAKLNIIEAYRAEFGI